MKKLLSWFKSGSSSENEEQIQLFTYFIPSPPPRKSGYREKELDSIFEQLVEIGFEICDYQTQALPSGEQPGLWVMARLRAKTEQARNTKVKDFPEEFLPKQDSHHDEVEGIYYID